MEASGEYRKFEIPRTYSAPLSPLPQLEKCKIERKLNALQSNNCTNYVPEDSKDNSYLEQDLWRQKYGERSLKTSVNKEVFNQNLEGVNHVPIGLLKVDQPNADQKAR